MPQEDRVYTFDDGSYKAQYLDKYLKEQGYNPKVVGVSEGFNLEEELNKLNPEDGYKVFLYYTFDDLRKDKERLREVIKGLESNGWFNLIVLPFEGMDEVSLAKKAKIKVVEYRPESIKDKTEWVGEVQLGQGEPPIRQVDPDTEMKDIVLPSISPSKSELDVASIDQDKEVLEFDFDPDKEYVKKYRVTDKEVKEVKNDTKKGRKRELSDVQEEQEGSVSA